MKVCVCVGGGGMLSRIPKSRRAQVTKRVRMHYLAALLSKFSLHVKYRTKQRQGAPFSFTPFKVVSAGQNIVSNSVRVHHLDALLSKFSLQVRIPYKIEAGCTIQFHYFQSCLCRSDYRIKQRQNAPFSFNAFKIFFQIVSNTIRMHALQIHCFHLFLWCSKYHKNA